VIVDLIDAADARARDFVSLTDMSLRRLREPAEGLFMAEGEQVIRRAVEAGYRPRAFLMSNKWLDSLADVVQAHPDVDVLLADEALLETITGFAVHRGALASMQRRPQPDVADVLAGAQRLIVLEDLVNHTNVGAVFRNAAALGVDAVLITPRCADPLYRRSVKVSMGAVFSVPWTRVEAWPAGLETLRDRGFTTIALTPAEGSVSIRDLAPPPQRWALILGTEGEGLRPDTLDACDLRVRIPMESGIDSLNVAAASAVACFALRS